MQRSLYLTLIIIAIFFKICIATTNLVAGTRANNVLVTKLDNFLEQNKAKNSSGITLEELDDAIKESENWKPIIYRQIQKSMPLIKCTHYLMTPLEQLLKQGDSIEAIKRLEKAWLLLRPDCSKLGSFYVRAQRSYDLQRFLLFGLKPKTTNKREDILKLMMKAVKEYKDNVKQFNKIELSHENLLEVRWILNYLNEDDTRILAKVVFPNVAKIDTDEQIEELSKKFTKEMENWGYKVKKDGSGIENEYND